MVTTQTTTWFCLVGHDGWVTGATGPGGPATRREAEVLALLGGRLSNAEIAERLHLSVRTVENHVSSLLRKYGAADRRALADVAVSDAEDERFFGLPAPLTSFIGRAAELRQAAAALAAGRLVTLQGPGGVGKTRLAIQTARQVANGFPGGGAFVDLIPAREEYVVQAVAAALDVAEPPGRSLAEAVADRLGDRRALLVLDNCEHVVEAVAAFAERLLQVCPGARILATSRERLGIPGERVIRLAPLPVDSDAPALFRDRAADAGLDIGGGFAEPGDTAAEDGTVAEICRRLDGIPLAIELAAARVAGLGPAGLLAALDDGVGLLSGGRGVDARHRSLHAVVGWSYTLLDESEQRLFRQLAVFAGPFDLGAAAAFGRADLLGRLVDKSLVNHDRAGYWQLLGTVRGFAVDRLRAEGEEAEAQATHRQVCAAVADQLLPRPEGWRERFDHVADDLRAAVASMPPGPDLDSHQLAHALARLTFARRFVLEAGRHFQVAAGFAPTPDLAAADLVAAAGCETFVNFSGDRAFHLVADAALRTRSAALAARALEIAARYPHSDLDEDLRGRLRGLLADDHDASAPTTAAMVAAAEAWSVTSEKLMPDPDLARHAEVTARATGDPVLICSALDAVRTAATTTGRLRQAHEVSQERLALIATLDRDDPRAAVEIEDAYSMAATDAIAAGDLRAALATAQAARDDDLIGGHPYLSSSMLTLAHTLTGAFDDALREATALHQALTRVQHPPEAWVAPAYSAAALAEGLRGETAASHAWHTRATRLAGLDPAYRHRSLAFTTFAEARLALHAIDAAENPGDTTELINRAFSEPTAAWYQSYALAAATELAVATHHPDARAHLTLARTLTQENAWAAACLARATARLQEDDAALEHAVHLWDRIGAHHEAAATRRLLPLHKELS